MQAKQCSAARGWAWAWLLVLCCLSACRRAAPDEHPLQVFVDGEPRLSVARADLARPLDLCAALALEPEDLLWVEVRADGQDPLKVKVPAERFPDRTLAAFPTAAGIGVGWVDQVRGALPERVGGLPPLSCERAGEVHVRVTRVEEPLADATPALLRIETSAGALAELKPDDLKAFPERTPREVLGQGEGSKNLAMPFLGDVLAASVPLAEVESVAVHTQAGETLELDAACLVAPAPRAPLIKVNRRGEWRLKVYEPSGSGVATSANLRNVVRIEVRLRGR